GTYTVVANFAGSADYTSATSAPVTFSISLPVVNSWDNAAGGDWDTASNWSLGHVPTLDEDAQITLPGNYTVTHAASTADVANSITSSVTITLSAGSLRVTTAVDLSGGSLTLAGGTLIGGTVNASGGAELLTTDQGGTLDDVTIGANSTLDSSNGVATV